jgi:hypothetical protein
MSTHQLHRTLGVSLKSTCFLTHRNREAMREPFPKMAGRAQTVQVGETFVGRHVAKLW